MLEKKQRSPFAVLRLGAMLVSFSGQNCPDTLVTGGPGIDESGPGAQGHFP